MGRREAERFERALQRAAESKAIEERLLPLVQTARQVSVLAEAPPPPPHRLAPGRQRVLAEAVQLRARMGPRSQKAQRQKERVLSAGTLKLATALVAAVLVFGLVLGAGQAVADSLPGGSLYSLKLAIEGGRLALTTAPQARADLNLALAEKRIDEITALAQQRQAVDSSTMDRTEQQLAAALDAAAHVENSLASRTLRRLEVAIQLRQRTMTAALEGLPDSEQIPLRQIMRVMERVRQEAHAGQGDPNGLRQRLRQGSPPDPTTPPSPSPGRGGPRPTGREGAGSGPHPSPTRRPDGPRSTPQPDGSPGPGPQPTHTRPSEGTEEPHGPHPTQQPADEPGHGPQPTDKPGKPKPTDQPGAGPQPTGEPGGPDPTEAPGHGPDPQPTDKPGAPSPPKEPGGDPGSGSSPAEEPGNSKDGGGKGKP